MLKKLLFVGFCCLISITSHSQNTLGNIYNRDKLVSLNGDWQYIIDPYNTGFFDYRFKEKNVNDPGAYWNISDNTDKLALIEHGYDDNQVLTVPGDWNSQYERFEYYEGTVWYKKTFDFAATSQDSRVFVYFGAVNYRADVYLNGTKLGFHEGGFTPFQFEIDRSLLKSSGNHLIVKVDNTRHHDAVPTVNTDWWNYGGITRDVFLVETPNNYIEDVHIELASLPTGDSQSASIKGWITLNQHKQDTEIVIEIPELSLNYRLNADGVKTEFSFSTSSIELWSPENPKLYDVVVRTASDSYQDKIGFRKIEVDGQRILLNGKPIFLRGICLHEEIGLEMRRAKSKDDAHYLLGLAKELNANFVRLAHYTHNEHMIRAADEMGLLLWSEIPVYWTINFSNPQVLNNAKSQMQEMVARDHNRASVIIWSVGNETPVSPIRTEFMKSLIDYTRELDNSRLVSAALEVHYNKAINTIDDPLGEFTDVVSVNEYLGWYVGLPEYCRTAQWQTIYDKPLIISETGAGAKQGLHGDALTRWTEEYQHSFYEEQIAMMKRMPSNYSGLAPWILMDFRSPKRNNPVIQQGWNRKGLISDKGEKKSAFYVLKEYYDEIESKHLSD